MFSPVGTADLAIARELSPMPFERAFDNMQCMFVATFDCNYLSLAQSTDLFRVCLNRTMSTALCSACNWMERIPRTTHVRSPNLRDPSQSCHLIIISHCRLMLTSSFSSLTRLLFAPIPDERDINLVLLNSIINVELEIYISLIHFFCTGRRSCSSLYVRERALDIDSRFVVGQLLLLLLLRKLASKISYRAHLSSWLERWTGLRRFSRRFLHSLRSIACWLWEASSSPSVGNFWVENFTLQIYCSSSSSLH